MCVCVGGGGVYKRKFTVLNLTGSHSVQSLAREIPLNVFANCPKQLRLHCNKNSKKRVY